MHVALGFLRADSGVVTRTAALIGWVPETTARPFGASAVECLDWLLRAHKVPTKQRRLRVTEVLTDVGLMEFGELPVAAYSRGMKQRLALGYAIAPSPQLLVLDEPTLGLDPHAVRVFRGNLQREAARGCGILISSHQLDELARVASRVYYIEAGKVARHAELREPAGVSLLLRFSGLRPDSLPDLPPSAQAWELNWPHGRVNVPSVEAAADLVEYLGRRGVRVALVERERVDLEGMLFPEEA
jgi:ABC-type multidrug transport system ATPase subunit